MKLVKLGIAVFCLLSIISPAKSQDSQQPIEVIPAVESVSYDGAAYKLSKSTKKPINSLSIRKESELKRLPLPVYSMESRL